jgi:hypothetical protein
MIAKSTAMKSQILLSLSVSCNLACVAWWLWPQPAAEPSGAELLPRASAIADSIPMETPPPVPATPPFHWSQLESTNYQDFALNLRRIGCPEQTIRDIISADLLAAMNAARTGAAALSTAQVEPLVNQVVGLNPGLQVATTDTHGRNGARPGVVEMDRPLGRLVGAQVWPERAASRGGETQNSGHDGGVTGGEATEMPRIDPSLLERRRQMRLEAIQRLWADDAVRSRYGIGALLEWQQQATREGTTLASFLERHQIPIPSSMLPAR